MFRDHSIERFTACTIQMHKLFLILPKTVKNVFSSFATVFAVLFTLKKYDVFAAAVIYLYI